MRELITAVLERKEMGWLGRVNPLLLSSSEKSQIAWIKKYVMDYGQTPTIERFQTQFKFFLPVHLKDPIGDIFDATVSLKRNEFFKEFVNSHHKALNDGEDPAKMIDELVAAMVVNGQQIVNMADYDRTNYFNAIDAISFGIPLIDNATGGLVDGDLVWIVGRPGSGKTTFMDWMISNWSLSGRKILYISNENSSENVIPKLDSLFGGWNPIKFRTKTWENVDKLKIKLVERILQAYEVEIIVPEAPAGTVADVAAMIEETQPDVVAIDGVYLMSESGLGGQRDWKDAAQVSSGLKRLARRTGIPFIGVIQASREAEGGTVGRGTIAHSDAFLQDADAIIAINFDQTSKTTKGQVIKSRWGEFSFAEFFEYKTIFDSMLISIRTADGVSIDAGEDW